MTTTAETLNQRTDDRSNDLLKTVKKINEWLTSTKDLTVRYFDFSGVDYIQ
jgi:hypothetical protein